MASILPSASTLCLAGAFGFAAAEDAWVRYRPVPQARTITDFHFTDTSNGWAIGDYGLLARTRDGGKTWEDSPALGDRQPAGALFFLNRDTGWVSNLGGLLMTGDGGETWKAAEGPALPFLSGMDFATARKGFAVGPNGAFYRTDDRGSSWRDLTREGDARSFERIAFVDSLHGWISGANGLLLRTRDGGSTWDSLAPPSMNPWSRRMSFVSPLAGWVATVGDTMIYRTGNGGVTWDSARVPGDMHGIQDIAFFGPLEGIAVGAAPGIAGVVWKTVDGGRTWTRIVTGLIQALTSVQALADGRAWAGGSHGAIFATRNRGDSWEPRNAALIDDFNDVDFGDAGNGWAVGQYGTVARTRDAGRTWENIPSPFGAPSMSACDFIDAETGFIAGYDTSDGARPAVFRTGDGGKTWSRKVFATGKFFGGLQFVDARTGWVFNADTLFRTDDGGDSWRVLPIPMSIAGGIRNMFWLDKQIGWFSGAGDELLKTTDGGATWEVQDKDDEGISSIEGIHFRDARNGWVVGAIGQCHRTRDGGKTWTRVRTGSTRSFYDVRFADSLYGVIVGQHGSLLTTLDGGDTWTRHLNQEGEFWDYEFRAVAFAEGRTAWTVGDRGNMFSNRPRKPVALAPAKGKRRTGIGTPWSFTLDRPGRVRIEAIDAAGRTVALLFEGHLPAGRHLIPYRGRPPEGILPRVIPAIRTPPRRP